MAFSSAPQFSSEQEKDIAFDGSSFFRTGNLSIERDMQLVNVFYDRVSQENKTRIVAVKKRSGLTTTVYDFTKADVSDIIRGTFYDVDQNAFYWATKDKVYVCRPDVSASSVLVTTLATSAGYVGFCSFMQGSGTRFVIFSDGTDLWVDNYAITTCTKVVDADMPTPHEPCPIYIDGYVLLIATNTSDIYTCDNDDPFTWTAGEFISAEISSDAGVKLVKAKNYIVCLGKNSIEYFYDAGNATGSPLSRNDSPFRTVGYITGLCTIGDDVFFVGKDGPGNLGVYKLNSFKVERVSNSVVDRTLQTYLGTLNEKAGVQLLRDGYCVSVDGHTYYVILAYQTTWAYDIDTHFWYEWKGSDGLSLKIEGAWNMYNGSCYVAIKGQQYMSLMHPSLYQDFGVNFTCKYVTESYTADTFHWKVCSKITLNCDMHNYTGTSNAQISWSNNDWADGGTVPRDLNVFSSSPYIVNTGRFRNRSFKIEYTDNYPIRMYGLKVNLNVMGN